MHHPQSEDVQTSKNEQGWQPNRPSNFWVQDPIEAVQESQLCQLFLIVHSLGENVNNQV
jgi:hypothetical protein